MNCPNCHSFISDDSKFCTKCGHKIEGSASMPEQQTNTAQPEPVQYNPNQPAQQTNPAQPEPVQYNPNQPAQQTNPAQPEPVQYNPTQYNPNQPNSQKPEIKLPEPLQKLIKNKKMLGITIGAAAALVIIIIALIAVAVNHKATIDLNDYVTVEFTGCDGYGSAQVNFDYTDFYEDVADKGKNTDKLDADDISSLSDLIGYYSDSYSSDYYYMLDSIDYSLDNADSLSNGDTVTVSFVYDNEYAAPFKLKFKGDDMEFEVEGLEEVTEVDPFEGIFLSFTGTSPNAYATVECSTTDNEFYNEFSYYYDLSKSSGISKGDVITVSIDDDNEEYFAESYGFKLTSFSKDFTCDSLDSYVSSLDDIDDDLLTSMKGQTEDVIEEYFANNSSSISCKDLSYEGCYFLTSKSDDSWYENNICYVIYSATVSSVADDDGETDFDPTKVYFPVKFTDILEYSDGTQYVDLASGTSISGETTLSTGFFSYVDGYTKKDVMYSELISAEKGSYNAEVSDSLEDK